MKEPNEKDNLLSQQNVKNSELLPSVMNAKINWDSLSQQEAENLFQRLVLESLDTITFTLDDSEFNKIHRGSPDPWDHDILIKMDPEADIIGTMGYLDFILPEANLEYFLSYDCLSTKLMRLNYIYPVFYKNYLEHIQPDIQEINSEQYIIYQCTHFHRELNYLNDTGVKKYLYRSIKSFLLNELSLLFENVDEIWKNKKNAIKCIALKEANLTKKAFFLKYSYFFDNEFIDLIEFISEYLRIEKKQLESQIKWQETKIDNRIPIKEIQKVNSLFDIWEFVEYEDKVKSYEKVIDKLVDIGYIYESKCREKTWIGKPKYKSIARFIKACIKYGCIKNVHTESVYKLVFTNTFGVKFSNNTRILSPSKLEEISEEELKDFFFLAKNTKYTKS